MKPMLAASVPSSESRLQSLQAAVLSYGVSTDGAPFMSVTLEDDEWQNLLTWAVGQRVVGLLRAMGTQLIEFTPQQDQQLRAASLAATTSSLHVESSISAVADALSAANVDWRLLKGAATSHLLYHEPGQRTIGDVDLLVRPADLDRALDALRPMTTIAAPVLHGPSRAAAQKEYPITDARGVEIDVHQAIEGSLVVSRLSTDALFERPQHLQVSGRRVATMSMPALFVHAVLHLTSEGAQMSTAPDIARLARRCSPSDALFVDLLAPHGVEMLFGYGLSLAMQIVPLSDEWHRYLTSHPLSRPEQRLLVWAHRRSARLAAVNLLTGPRRLRRLGETVWPSAEFLARGDLTRIDNAAGLVKKACRMSR